ncbi:MAG TPA: hypothetical protein VNX70_11585 [Bryobacteraceae bacterium]|nr:hypothetical protein [Bryobacteraceae bacterium]
MRLIMFGLVASFLLLAADLGGTYKGSYSGSAGASGDFVISLTKADGGEWKSEVTFTLAGADVKTKITSLAIDGSKVKIVYEFDLQGTALESTVTGELNGATLAGDYHTKVVADGSAVDEGTWKTTASQ